MDHWAKLQDIDHRISGPRTARYVCPTSLHCDIEVPSSSTKRVYTVTFRAGKVYCTCAGFYYGAKKCKHIKIAESKVCDNRTDNLFEGGPSLPGKCSCGEDLVEVYVSN